MEIINDGNCMITLCYYPMFEWNHSRYIESQMESKSWMIHSRIHNTKDCDAYRIIKDKFICELNAGIDINNYEPAMFNELVFNNNAGYERNGEMDNHDKK